MIQPKLIISPGVDDMPQWSCYSPMHMTKVGYGATPLGAYLDFLFKNGPAYDPVLTHP